MFKIPAPTFSSLAQSFEGELYHDQSPEHEAMRLLYATDASVYQEKPLAVALPKTPEDIKRLVRFARQNQTSLIPRAAGTSLAGQVVGGGIVADCSKYFSNVLEINPEAGWVRVQPGVIRDDLNAVLKPHGLMFGPETSTASRAMVGGMIGNNSCGLHSIVWGSTRHHLLEVKAILSDGAEVTFRSLSRDEFDGKCRGVGVVSPLEQRLYQQVRDLLSGSQNQKQIRAGFPKPTITRRNTGYALDELLPFFEQNPDQQFNFCKLIAGSEGTLCFITEAKLNLLPLPPKKSALVCAHFVTIRQSLEANLVALEHRCSASELVDDYILQLTKGNIEQAKNRDFVEGDPKAVLMVEFFDDTVEAVTGKANRLITALKEKGLGYAFPILFDQEAVKAWNLRKAGLSIMYNIPGDDKPANVIEDCAVDVRDLPDYIDELDRMAAEKHGLTLEYSAHAGAGELHVLPLINLKSNEGRLQFRALLADTAELVKKYGGSLSGEHGDGRLRGEFIPYMIGDANFQLVQDIKRMWDPQRIFNPGKIVDTPPMNEFLRYQPDQKPVPIDTIFDFSAEDGILNLAEKCSGSGDCRKTAVTGGTMCPSYMATRRERDTTRARANILRQFLTNSDKSNQFDHEEIKEVMDLCLSCKGCKSECPSSVDISRMKAEFLQHYYDANGTPLRSRLIGNFTKLMSLASVAPWAYNAIYDTPALRRIANRMAGFHPDRTMPELAGTTLKKWWKNRAVPARKNRQTVYLFCDEFTNYNDVEVGQKTIQLLERLGYDVIIPDHLESGRTYLSKGLVRDAQKIAIENVNRLKDLITAETPLIGIEPSAILGFRDEYADLMPPELKAAAQHLAKNSLLVDEFIAQEMDRGNITKTAFTSEKRLIKLHGHCHQKALASQVPTKRMLSLPENYEVQLIPSGCCGMAGSFGYEKEHYALSMQVGELVLFPTVREQPAEVLIAAPGTSCRHQIKDGTGRLAKHPAEILFEALN
ncbi:FAD-binding and (Fe-S)-binding domain-containing protein [Larkinella sp. C7]|jgi:FAD/FMN-containing dehydrogenase/Fe-S oxidoreductase|uniref:FAD-binding and (Fe-S)-binding domain-containing protein n=1 Tax=Larkinella sp. C7 TaxID=2576607 RepID=UPI00111147B9|nr:FAD-binding and (Fe-S)-binding domain-containing protein [Larkinella sp. C7]